MVDVVLHIRVGGSFSNKKVKGIQNIFVLDLVIRVGDVYNKENWTLNCLVKRNWKG